ncbi:MAG: hypothetical protein JNN30_16280 [Rhodanobacteraceae bacterium]|nr:hypothetical protein [Rhodanobacteraceae bacterium]
MASYFAVRRSAGFRLAGLIVAGMLALVSQPAGAVEQGGKTSANTEACALALLQAAETPTFTVPPDACQTLVSRTNWQKKPIAGSAECSTGNLAGCLEAAFDIDSPREILGFVRQHCSALVENAWQPRYGGPEASEPALQTCRQALKLLERRDIKSKFDGRAEQRRSRLVGECLLPLENCRDPATCRDLPLCAAALYDLPCSGEACTRWFERDRLTAERQRELGIRAVMEQIEDRDQRRTEVKKTLRQQDIVAEDARDNDQNIAYKARASNSEIAAAARANDQEIAYEARISDSVIAQHGRDTADRIARESLDMQREIAQGNHDAAGKFSTQMKESLGDLASAIEKLSGEEPSKTESPVRQIDPNQPIEDLFPEADSISYAIATLPHPAVPRHRRSYYAATDSLDSGMHANGYNFVTYYDPWTEYRDAKNDSAPDSWQLGNFANDASYGIRIYRHEGWRCTDSEEPCDKATRLRVLFIVGETQTYGVQRKALDAALWRSVAEVHREHDSNSPLTMLLERHVDKDRFNASELIRSLAIEVFRAVTDAPCYVSPRRAYQPCPTVRINREVLVLGPTFSGSVDGLSQAASTINEQLQKRILIPLKLVAELKSLRHALDDEEARKRRYSIATDSTSTTDGDLTTALAKLRRCLDALELRSTDRTGKALIANACKSEKVNKAHEESKEKEDHAENFCQAQIENTNCSSDPDKQPQPVTIDRVFQLYERASQLANKLGYAAILTPKVQVSIHAISATATATSNSKINSTNPERFTQQTLAISDERKLCSVLKNMQKVYGSVTHVALLHEPTAFGRDAYLTLRRLAKVSNEKEESAGAQCKLPFTISEDNVIGLDFPPNISDLRQKLRDSDKQARTELDLTDLTTSDSHLPIDEGVENGNEYPNGAGSKLAAVAADQRLRLQLDKLASFKPDLIIVVASDVRDRLYLFDRLSRTASDAALVDLEADLLLGHPDYLHATRGIRMVSSSALYSSAPDPGALNSQLSLHCTEQPTAGYLRQFDSDRSALLHELVRCNGVLFSATQPLLYRIGKHGPVPDLHGAEAIWAKATWNFHGGLASGAALAAGLLAFAYCLVQLVQSTRETRTTQLPGATRVLMAAPWWNSPMLRLRDARRLTALVAVGVVIGLLIIPSSELLSTQPGFRALLQLTLLAALAQILWYVITRRLRDWMRHIELAIRASGAKELVDWAELPGPKPNFVATPVLAGSYWFVLKPDMAAELFRSQLTALEFGFQDSLTLRLALRQLLLPGLRAVFRLACVSFVACLAVVLVTLFYPVPHRSVPLVGAFLLLLSGTWLATAHTIAFERSGLLSRLYCGTEAGLKISTQLIATIAGPLTLLILSLILADQPGVMDTAGGLLKWLATLK